MSNVDIALESYGLDREQYANILEDIDQKLNKQLDVSWQDIADKYEIDLSGESIRKAQQLPIFGGNFVKHYYEDLMSRSDDSVWNQAYFKAKEERVKAQTERIELNRWLREKARDDMLYERISESIKTLQPLKPIKHHDSVKINHQEKEVVIFFGDCHYGVEFEYKDVYGRVINAYSPEIFKDRMEYLLSNIINIVDREHVDKIHVVDIGDNIDGIIRLTSQLMKLRYGVIESTIGYAEYMSAWLQELSQYVAVDYHMVMDGNHTQLRLCGAPKGAFPEENMTKIIQAFIKERLKDNECVCVVENESGNVFFNVCGYNLLAIHGEVKDMSKALEEYSHVYNTKIAFLIAGHYHRSKSEELASDCCVYNIPSVMGADSYAISLRKKSNAGAVAMVFKPELGRVCEYNIKLNNI